MYGVQGMLPRDCRVEMDYNKSILDVYLDAAVSLLGCLDSADNAPVTLVMLASHMDMKSKDPNADRVVAPQTYITKCLYEYYRSFSRPGTTARRKEIFRQRLKNWLSHTEAIYDLIRDFESSSEEVIVF